MLSPPPSTTKADFDEDKKATISSQIDELRVLFEETERIIYNKVTNFNSISERLNSIRDNNDSTSEVLNRFSYHLGDLLGKFESKLRSLQETEEEARADEENTFDVDSRSTTFGFDHSEREQTINDTYESLTSAKSTRKGESAGELVNRLQEYLESVSYILKPALAGNFNEILGSIHDLTDNIPSNSTNIGHLSDLVASMEATIGSFTE